ncbi:MAG: hypothetical protein E7561_01720 [Ruminococcaceae bacterium]|nr:hypothetical protein [Oscillospiraceae bacterium]
MEKTYKKYFLAANSSEGFLSHFGDCYDEQDGWRVYIIKGGPGTGKSSLMKKIATKARIKGLDVNICPCSSDPDSLDGVIIEEIKTVVLDGTAPHILEPKLVGVCENIVNLCDNWDTEILFKNKEKIIESSLKNKHLHKTASRYLVAAGQAIKENLQLALAATDIKSVIYFTEKICNKLIPTNKKNEGREWVRFFTGITPKGLVDFTEENTAEYSKRVIISDPYGAVSSCVLKTVRQYALSAGHTVITVKNPFLPSLLIDAVLLPELDLCFLSENGLVKIDSDERRIHARRFMDISLINRSKERRRFNNKIFKELVLSASKTLYAAKSVHDEIEGYYIAAMDFNKNAELAEKLWKQIDRNSL